MLIRRRSLLGAGAGTLLNGIVAYWKMGESSGNLLDSVGSDDAVPINSPTQGVTGKIGNACSFNGIDNYVEPNIAIKTAPFTISFWTKQNIAPVLYDVITGRMTNSNFWNDAWQFYWESTSDLRFVVGTWDINFAAATGLTWADWNHILGTWDGTTIRLYVNNVEGTSGTFTGTLAGTKKVNIGRGQPNNAYNVDAIVDEYGIWNRVLTAAEITELYNSGAGLTHPF